MGRGHVGAHCRVPAGDPVQTLAPLLGSSTLHNLRPPRSLPLPPALGTSKQRKGRVG